MFDLRVLKISGHEDPRVLGGVVADERHDDLKLPVEIGIDKWAIVWSENIQSPTYTAKIVMQ
jgi:hypothetical protein